MREWPHPHLEFFFKLVLVFQNSEQQNTFKKIKSMLNWFTCDQF